MKIVFAGPSIHGLDLRLDDVEIRGPAEMGDVERAVAEGATVIGLIDGHYQQVGAVWHKELLLALTRGVTVFGAASMGALRASECEPFGMIPVGDIARRYCSGALFDDADVAVVNLPAELGFAPVTEPMVNVSATIAKLRALRLVESAEAESLALAAKTLFFADRTIEAVVEAARLGPRAAAVEAAYRANLVNRKAEDALELIEAVRAVGADAKAEKPANWRFAHSPFWENRPVRT